MIDLKLTEAQLDELHQAASENPRARARRKCWVVYLRGKGYACREIADVVRVDADTVTEYARKYRDGGLFGLLAEDYRRPDGRLDGHAERLKEVFKQRPPHTVSQAIEMIEQETGVRLKPSAGRALLRKLGLRFRRCGLVPGKAPDDEQQRQAQQTFHDKKLQPMLEEARQGKRTVLFVDAAHFVMGAFLGMLWSFVRQLLPSSSGRQRYNVLGAYDPIRHEVVTEALGIELLYLPAYSPNLNLIERLWRFVKKQVLYSRHYDKFAAFKDSIDNCLRDLGTRFKSNMQTLMTLKFQLFSKTENLAA